LGKIGLPYTAWTRGGDEKMRFEYQAEDNRDEIIRRLEENWKIVLVVGSTVYFRRHIR
jgi:hypothetical protein